MAKTSEVKKIKPSEAIRSLTAFNETVLMLKSTLEMGLAHKLIDEKIATEVENSVRELRLFYNAD